MKFSLIIFTYLLSLKTFAFKDFAHVKVSDKVFFKSESELITKSFKSLECVFGETLQTELIRKVKMGDLDSFLFKIKLAKYSGEIGFDVPDKKMISIIGRQKLDDCNFPLKVVNILENRRLVLAELYLQEYFLGVTGAQEMISYFKRLLSLLNKRYPHFVYES